MKEQIAELNDHFSGETPDRVIAWFVSEYTNAVAFSSSLGAEDQVITSMLSVITPPVRMFTLDTGRMFQESYDLMHITEQKYGLRFELFFPAAARVEEMVRAKGINLFYDSIENRRLCCSIRKIEPLERALKGVKVWITGLRKAQSVTRNGLDLITWDQEHGLIKLNPLINWSDDVLWNHIKQYRIPYNELHDKGYPSIGCLPCTRAVQPGENVRAGRWWWELPEFKECGLHKKT